MKGRYPSAALSYSLSTFSTRECAAMVAVPKNLITWSPQTIWKEKSFNRGRKVHRLGNKNPAEGCPSNVRGESVTSTREKKRPDGGKGTTPDRRAI